MKYSFRVIIQRDSAESIGTAVIFPQLNNLRLTISEGDIERIRQAGYQVVCERIALSYLKTKDLKGELVKRPKSLDAFFEGFFKKGASSVGSEHNLDLTVLVEFESKSRWHTFEKILPTVTKATILGEIGFGTIMTLGTLQMTEGMIHASAQTTRALAITQTVMSALFMLGLTFTTPGIALMGDWGADIDEGLSSAWDFLRGKKPDEEKSVAPAPQTIPCKLMAALRIFQVGAVLGAFNQILSEANQDYQQLDVLTNEMNAMPDAMMPRWLTTTAMIGTFGLNQINDPVQLITQILMLFLCIKFIILGKLPVDIPAFIEGLTEDWMFCPDDQPEVAVTVAEEKSAAAIELTSVASRGYQRLALHAQDEKQATASQDSTDTLRAGLLANAQRIG